MYYNSPFWNDLFASLCVTDSFFSLLVTDYQVEAEKRREEQRNFGVFFDDDYNYLQHLKESSGKSELVASGPSHVDQKSVNLHEDAENEEEDHSVMAVPVSFL